MSALGHVFESAGIATVALALNEQQARNIGPPRALVVDFPLGRPLGRPEDPAFQRAVLDAAFELLPRTDGPVLEVFPEAIDDRVDEPLTCPLPPRSRSDEHPAIDELRSLRPAWDRAQDQIAATQVGRVHGPDDLAESLRPFISVIDGAAWTDVDFGGDPAALLMDVRAYYEEAALGLSDHVPDARQAESWLYRSTATGLLMHDFFDAVKDADPRFPAVFSIVPMSQQD